MTLVIDTILDPLEPLEQVPEYIFEDIDLGGVSWNYRLRWNDRAERWTIDVYSSDGEKAIYGKRLVPNYPLFWANTGRRPEGGYLMLYDTGDASAAEQCTYDGLGHRWQLVWLVDDGTDAPADRPWTITVP
jgi:hypothetical protein